MDSLRVRLLATLLLVLPAVGAAALRSCGRRPLRVATFNIERYGNPAKATDERRLARLLAGLDADVIAVQEIEDPPRFARLVETLGVCGRRYRFAPSRCGGRSDDHEPMHVGFAYDRRAVRLLRTREYPELAPVEDEACVLRDRPGLLAEFEAGGRRFALLVVHFRAMPEQAAWRREQWLRALRIARAAHEGGLPVAILGDVNSTGFKNDDQGERRFIEEQVEAAGLALLTREVPCTEYFDPDRQGRLLEPSMLDHVAATPDFPMDPVARVRGFCAEVGCRPRLTERPPDFTSVSDHCPVIAGAP